MTSLLHRFFAAALAGSALFVAVPVAAQELKGTVQRVVDGDSFWLQPTTGGKPVEVRLQGIDAPEGCQAWGKQSKAALEEWVQGQTLQVRSQGRDQHGRVLGIAFVNSQNLNAKMVQEGHAWSSRFRWDQGPYVKEERQAQVLKRGLHGEPGAIPPRQFRKQNGPCPKV